MSSQIAEDPPEAVVSREVLGRRLRALLGASGYSAREVAAKTGIKASTLSRWHHAQGADYPPVSRLSVLCAFYGEKVSDVLDPDWHMRVSPHGRGFRSLISVPAGSVVDATGAIHAPLPGMSL